MKVLGWVIALVVGVSFAVAPVSSVSAAEKSTAPAAKSAPAAKGAVAQAPKAPVDVNTATASDLKALPGVGDKLAQAIVDYRTKNGKFKTVDDLKNVSGIGDKNLAKIKPLVVAK